MSDTAELQAKWIQRLNDVEYINERTMFVTRDEYIELQRMEAQSRDEEPPEVAEARRLREEMDKITMGGVIGRLFATPIVIDSTERNAQVTRIAFQRAADRG